MAKIKGNKKGNKLGGTKHGDKIKGLGGDDVLKGKAGDDKLLGGTGNDRLDGGEGNDILKGGAGDDLMISGPGGDLFDGGDGIDTVSFADNPYAITVELLLLTQTYGGLQDAFRSVENIDGSAFNDTIEGDGADNHFRGLGGNDALKGGDGNDILEGGDGNDQLYSDSGAAQLIGGAGYDSFVYEKAGSGAVIDLAAGTGGGSAAGDTFSSIERVFGSKYGDTIKGAGAAEAFFGEGGNDNLYGNDGKDTLFGGSGEDNLYGGANDDWLAPEGDVAEADHLYGGSGFDWADYDDAGGGVTVNLRTGVGGGRALGDTYDSIENVRGSDYDDTLIAGLNGRADGGWGDDFVYDNVGTEVLRGERGDDTLSDNFLGISEDGLRDIFVLEYGLGFDTVQGFSQSSGATGDRLWLQEGQFAIAHNADGTLVAGQIVNAANPVASTAQQHLLFETGSHILYYDPDGSGATLPVAIAKLEGVASLHDYDFLVVPNL